MSCFCRSVVEGGGVRTTQGATVFVCRRVVGGGGVRTTDGVTVFVCRNKKKQRKGIADWLFQGGGQNNTRGHSLCLYNRVETKKKDGAAVIVCSFLLLLLLLLLLLSSLQLMAFKALRQ